jgi:VIT1/CCC1 family predicted Fe2+/Mn2+ transporter
MFATVKRGLSFGLTSGVITTLGLLIGLAASTNSKAVVLSGILMIAIADALSDATGMHISEEQGDHDSTRQIWLATVSTFAAKFVFALTFAVPILLCGTLMTGVVCDIIWGVFLLAIFSWYIARRNKTSAFKTVGEHLLIAAVVIVITHFLGQALAG